MDNFTNSEKLILERAHRLCIKRMQSLGMYTRTDTVLTLIGIFPLEIEIDFRKLTLFGQFCRANTCTWMKREFLFRLLSYVNCRENVQQGFIPDVLNLFEKYQLMHIVHTYVSNVKSSSKFPSKFDWNRLLKNKLHSSAINAWHSRTLAQDFESFNLNFDHIGHGIFLKGEGNF